MGWIVLSGGIALAQSPEDAHPPEDASHTDEEWTPDSEYDLEYEDGRYRTPLAGERLETEVFGERVEIPERDRGKTIALNFGMAAYAPSVGGTTTTPIFAAYTKHYFKERRIRATASVLVNTVDYAEDFGGVESLLRFENYTIPFETRETVEGTSLDRTALEWGYVRGAIGMGYRWALEPGNVDNDLRVGVYYHAGYEYHDRTEDTPDDTRTARDTYTHGVLIQLRADAIQRNLLELPHWGWALGADVEFTRRDRWRAYGDPQLQVVDSKDTRDYWKLRLYAVLATPVPGLSERHRFLLQVHGALSPGSELDRFSGFRLDGGPVPTETQDLARAPFPGTSFNQFPIQDFLVATIEYRFEVLFFLFVHARFNIGLGNIPTLRGDAGPNQLTYQRKVGYSASAAVTSGFLFDSQIYTEIAYDFNGNLRGGTPGTSFLLLWSKAF